MYFHKYPHQANFEFPAQVSPSQPFVTRKGACKLEAFASGEDIYFLRITDEKGEAWGKNYSQAGISFPEAQPGLKGATTRLVFSEEAAAASSASPAAAASPATAVSSTTTASPAAAHSASASPAAIPATPSAAPSKTRFTLQDETGATLLSSPAGRFFGRCGEASVFEFEQQPGDQYYGLGEKWTGFEHSGKTHKFWNTDVWADFHPEAYLNGKPAPDPVYVSIPYIILKRGSRYIGLLMDNPHATTIATGAGVCIADQMQVAGGDHSIRLFADRGQPNLYVLVGPSLAELTRKLQRLVGPTPLPPVWALGYQQCRWGYKSAADLEELDAKFTEHGIPVDGLWLDIDYMDRYKVFTFQKEHFPDPAATFKKLLAKGRKVVPIIDPGVKLEPGYAAYESGLKAKAFCQNPNGGEFVGLVWPGETVFPDFSLESARQWWSGQVKAMGELGLYGAWLDMNDPATGSVDNQQMLFGHGQQPHDTFHNQYALGMAMASRQGFLAAHPGERPFLLSRSGFTGSGRHTAIWTGDNVSNYHHLKSSIATTLNLALSGIPFNGPDAGGFGHDTTPELIADWFKAGFLFPFFRNHATFDARKQEPWAFDEATLETLRHFVRLRYRLRPYLYQLFIQQERSGEAILRPLFYDFDETEALPLGGVDDQFMVGPALLQAPFVEAKQKRRKVVLPGDRKEKAAWFDIWSGAWLPAGKKITVAADGAAKGAEGAANPLYTPLFVRNGSILPLARLEPHDHAWHGDRADFHIYLSGDGEISTRYVFDDGHSLNYRNGGQSEVKIWAKRTGNSVAVEVGVFKDGAGKGDFTFTLESGIRSVTINDIPAKPAPAQGLALGAAAMTTWQAA